MDMLRIAGVAIAFALLFLLFDFIDDPAGTAEQVGHVIHVIEGTIHNPQ
jgi:hypothetical protein